MENSFLQAVKKLGSSEPKVMAESAFALFKSINDMDAPTVISAYQAFRFCVPYVHAIEDAALKRSMEKIDGALITRMKALLVNAPKEDRKAVALVFSSAMGGGHMICFANILES